MNRHERRRSRKLYEDYIRHLPQERVDDPLEAGAFYHVCVFHDDWCNHFIGGQCNCNAVVERYTEPRRS
jgi:hypothetical protein